MSGGEKIIEGLREAVAFARGEKTGVRAISITRTVCWPWRLRDLTDESTRGADCRCCGREVAAPDDRERRILLCTYCALDRGWLAPIDRPFGSAAR